MDRADDAFAPIGTRCDDPLLPTPKLLWRPSPTKSTSMTDFRDKINSKFGLQLNDYHQLYKWSCEHYSDFWEEYYKFSGIIASEPFSCVVDSTKNISDIPKWFKGARLNYAENLLRYQDDRVALYGVVEGRTDEVQTLTFKQLRNEVARYASSMRRLGITIGDRVVGYIPNCKEAIVAMLATASIGAIWSSTSPDFGTEGVLSRFSQISPKLLFTVNAVIYNGKTHDHLKKVNQVLSCLPSLSHAVILPFVSSSPFDISLVSKGCTLEDFLSFGAKSGPSKAEANGCNNNQSSDPQLHFEQVPFDHPLFIMYSSGTTGAPKCMVHSVGGTLIQHLKEHQLHGNTTRDDVLMYYTTTGWMMWNWLVGALALGAALVLYDGSPLVPSAAVLWDLVDQLGITIFGTGAKWLSVLEEKGVKPKNTHNLSSLHTILSTGSPLRPSSYDFVYSCIKGDVLLGSISGGTDIISCFMGQNVCLPVHRGEIQCSNLGMDMHVWNELGEDVQGESGELVCLTPFPCMPTHFWDDHQGFKYKKAYFAKFNGVWAHGDFCILNPKTRGWTMLGRSDGTLNPNGVRFGSAEIYNIVEGIEDIQDSLCVPQKNAAAEERIILFVKMLPGKVFDENIVGQLKARIRAGLSARHVPALILPTHDIPYTISGKKVEVAVKKILAGQSITERGAFANPNSLDLYWDLKELQGW